MEKLRHLVLTLVFISVAGCKDPNFGDQARDFMKNEARSYSERLTQKDLEVRWPKFFQRLAEVSHTEISEIEVGLGMTVEALQTSNKALASKKEDPKTLIAARRQIHDALLGALAVRGNLDRFGELVQDYEEACSRRNFDERGLGRLGVFSVMESFNAIAKRQKDANDDKVGIYLFFASGGETEEQENSNILKELLKTFETFYETLKAWEKTDEIEEQADILRQAIGDLPNYLLNADEVFEISEPLCASASELAVEEWDRLEKIRQGLERQWRGLYMAQWNAWEAIESKLRPIRVAIINGEYEGLEEIRRLFDESLNYELGANIIRRLDRLHQLHRASQKIENPLHRLQAEETVYDEAVRLQILVSNAEKDARFWPSLNRLQDYLATIVEIQGDLQFYGNELEGRKG